MNSQGFFVITFLSTSDTIAAEKAVRQHFDVSIIPMPREVSKSCGFAIRFAGGDSREAEILKYFRQMDVKSYLYFIEEKHIEGHRNARLIASH